MPIRPIIRIDEEKCTGCGRCVPDCAEGALQIIAGKARLASEVFCDGLGACLGACPEGALKIEDREAEAFDAAAAQKHLPAVGETLPCGCPGSLARTLASGPGNEAGRAADERRSRSRLRHWPVQLRLVAPDAPFLREADVLVCADCVPFAMPDLHERYLANRAVLVGCPKLDDLATYGERLEAVFRAARPRSMTVLRMEVPCCGGLAAIAKDALERAGSDCRLDVRVVPIQGEGTAP